MPNKINTVQCKLIGISCLEGAVNQRAKQEWNARFLEQDSFWVDVKNGDTAKSIAQTITTMMREQGIAVMGRTPLILAIFLDLTKAPDEILLEEILGLPSVISRVLTCTVSVNLEFGYLDQPAFGDADVLKENVRRVVAKNCEDPSERKQLCLVGISPLWEEDEDVSWKMVMVCLDILRRNSSPANILPADGHNPCDNVGFLRYGEYDQKKLTDLTSELTEIEAKLSDNGAMALRNKLNEALTKIERDVEMRYAIDGNSQPLHPDMYVEGFLKKKFAERGREPFASARNATWHALNTTANNLKKLIFESYREQIEKAPEYLQQFIKSAEVGVMLECDSKHMEDILTPEPVGVVEPITPGLAYKETGYFSEIDNYLKAVRRYAGAKVRHDFAKALLDAYKQVPADVYNARRCALQQEYTNTKGKISRQMTKKQLIDLVAQGAELPKKAFQITQGGGRSALWVVSREEATSIEIDREIAGTMATGYYIDALYGGLKELDNAPVKALQLLQFRCNEDCLSDLIG